MDSRPKTYIGAATTVMKAILNTYTWKNAHPKGESMKRRLGPRQYINSLCTQQNELLKEVYDSGRPPET